jgi:hypothetical protein
MLRPYVGNLAQQILDTGGFEKRVLAVIQLSARVCLFRFRLRSDLIYLRVSVPVLLLDSRSGED